MQIGFGLSIMGVPQIASQGGGGPAPSISIASGSGYAGSVYASTMAGQWYADGVAITGALGNSIVMAVENEGKGIRCGNSNIIRVWAPINMQPSTNLSRRRAETVTVSGGYVTSWENLGSAGGALSQTTAAEQPQDNVVQINGQPTIRFSRESALPCSLNFPYDLASGEKTVIFIGKDDGLGGTIKTVIGGGTRFGSNNTFLPLAQKGAENSEYVRGFTGLKWFVNGALTNVANRGQAFNALYNDGLLTCHEMYTESQSMYTSGALLGSSAITPYYPLGFDVAEVIIVDRALTDDERASLSAYANAVYGVAA